MVCLACYATMYEEEVVQSLTATIHPPLFYAHIGEIEFWWVRGENTWTLPIFHLPMLSN